MAKKTKMTKIDTPQEVHEKLFACINCVYEKECLNVFPFPLNLCDCCERYKKEEKEFE